MRYAQFPVHAVPAFFFTPQMEIVVSSQTTDLSFHDDASCLTEFLSLSSKAWKNVTPASILVSDEWKRCCIGDPLRPDDKMFFFFFIGNHRVESLRSRYSINPLGSSTWPTVLDFEFDYEEIRHRAQRSFLVSFFADVLHI